MIALSPLVLSILIGWLSERGYQHVAEVLAADPPATPAAADFAQPPAAVHQHAVCGCCDCDPRVNPEDEY